MKPAITARLGLYAICALLLSAQMGCDTAGETFSPEDFDIHGTWALTELQGAPGPVNASNSTWTFRGDGTYEWFFIYPEFFDLQGQGGYVLDGDVLTLTGIFANTVISASADGRVALTLDENRFSFRDDDGDRWTYVRQ